MHDRPPYGKSDTPDVRARRRAAKAKWQRDYRARLKAREAVFPVRAGGRVLNALLALGWLSPADADDKKKIGAAMAAVLADLAKDF